MLYPLSYVGKWNRGPLTIVPNFSAPVNAKRGKI